MAPELIEVGFSRAGDFEDAFNKIMAEIVAGSHDKELSAAGIAIPDNLPIDAVKLVPRTTQAVGVDEYVQLAIDYSPVFAAVGKDLWAWVWPKLRARFDKARAVTQKSTDCDPK